MKNILYFFLFLIFFYNQNLLANQDQYKNEKFCYELNYDESINLNPDNFKKFQIEIFIPNQRKWNKIILREEVKKKEINASKYYFYKNRDRVKAILLINTGNIKCKLYAKIRPHGDLYDHRIGSGLPSLNINLIKGHIFGIVEFILFRPKTRNFDNEVFATTLFREVGLFAPRSANVTVSYGRILGNFIFQEKINKEFLENQNLREGPILEGDERFRNTDSFSLMNLSKHRISNYHWSQKTKSNLIISEFSLSLLNMVNQYHNLKSNLSELDIVDYYYISKQTNYFEYFENLAIFDALMFSIDASHGLSREDRRFYFDPIFKKFYPIYYDGMVSALSFYKNINLNENFNQVDYSFDKLDLSDGKVTPSSVEGSEAASLLLEKIDTKKFYLNLNNNGMNFSYEATAKLLEKIKKRINLLKNINPDRLLNISYNSTLKENINSTDEQSKIKLVFYDDDFDHLLSCNSKKKNCKSLFLDIEQKAKLIGQELRIDNYEYIFVGKRLKSLTTDGWYDEKYFNFDKKKNNFTNRIILNDVSINIIGNVQYKLDKNKKTLEFLKEDKTGRVIIDGGYFKDWTINFLDRSQLVSIGGDINGLTGCLTIVDVKLENINIDIINSKCEDAVNFIRSNGDVKNIRIEGSEFDSIDSDFSNINFSFLNINKSKNDCLDFSYGKYYIVKSVVNYCGDKGISVGENSNLNIESADIFNSATGLASKDFSTVNIKRLNIDKVDFCAQLYNKKNEFSGASLDVYNLRCVNFKNKFNIEKNSFLKVRNEF